MREQVQVAMTCTFSAASWLHMALLICQEDQTAEGALGWQRGLWGEVAMTCTFPAPSQLHQLQASWPHMALLVRMPIIRSGGLNCKSCPSWNPEITKMGELLWSALLMLHLGCICCSKCPSFYQVRMTKLQRRSTTDPKLGRWLALFNWLWWWHRLVAACSCNYVM